MSEYQFIETNAGTITDMVIEELENGVNEPLYPGDERRIFGDALGAVIVQVYHSVNDACRQKMLRNARGTVLDTIGESRDVYRMNPSCATTTLRFSIDEPLSSNIVIPSGLRVSNDFEHYFRTDATVVLYAGTQSVDVTCTAEEGGSDYNGIAPGGIINIIDISTAPLIDSVTNLTETVGGGNVEDDESLRERIRQAENRLSTAGPTKAYKYWALSANSLITDAAVVSERETIARKLRVYDLHVFLGGTYLLPDTLKVYLPDESIAEPGRDYEASYEDELLTIGLTEAYPKSESVTIQIDREMQGRVKIVPICAGGELPDENILNQVLDKCNSESIRPLTDYVQVEAPTVEYFDIDIIYYTTRANESDVVETVEGAGGAIDQYIYWQSSSLDRDINPDELRKRILSPDWDENLTGATRVIINKPEYKEIGRTTVAKFSGNLTVRHMMRN